MFVRAFRFLDMGMATAPLPGALPWTRLQGVRRYFAMGFCCIMMTIASLLPSSLHAQEHLYLDTGIHGSDAAVFDGTPAGGGGEVIWENPPYHFYYPLMDTVGYIKPERVPAIGQIVETLPLFQKSIQEGGKVYLEIPDESMVMVGDQFQLLRIIPLSGNEESFIDGKQHYLTGIIEIVKLSVENPCCGMPGSRAQGKIVTAYRDILPHDILVPYNTQNAKISLIAPNEALNGRILFSEEHARSISENAVVFIDKGKIHGLKVGQYYDIYNHPKAKKAPSAPYMEKREYKGSLMVIRMEDETSAALITYSYKPISPGDFFFPSTKVNL